jgi:hypothetical protein
MNYLIFLAIFLIQFSCLGFVYSKQSESRTITVRRAHGMLELNLRTRTDKSIEVSSLRTFSNSTDSRKIVLTGAIADKIKNRFELIENLLASQNLSNSRCLNGEIFLKSHVEKKGCYDPFSKQFVLPLEEIVFVTQLDVIPF